MAAQEVKDFTGGLVDEYIGAPANKWQLSDNLIVTQDKKKQNRPGSLLEAFGSSGRVDQSGPSVRIGLMMPYKGFNFRQVVSTLQYGDISGSQELLGPGGDSAFEPVTDAETAFCYSTWNNHCFIAHDELNQRPIKVYENSGTFYLRTAGLPKPAGTPTWTGEVGSGSNYVYAFVYRYTYIVDGVTFVDRSAPLYVSRTASTPATSITVTPLALSNTSATHYDTSAIVIEAYRTANNGTVFYKAGEITNGSTTITISWATTNTQLYTTGGVAENDRPPIAKYVHMTTNFGYYAHFVDIASGEILKNVLCQSKQGDPDSCPAQFNVEFEEEIKGVSSVRSIPVVFTDSAIYRVDGFFDLLGRGGMNPIKIADDLGGIGQLSLVQTLDWLYFAATDGFYRTNGYDVQKLSDNEINSFNAQYKSFLGSALKEKRVCGVSHAEQERVLWAVEKVTEENSGDNNSIMCFDTRNGVFTSWSSGYADEVHYEGFEDNFRPTALSVMNKSFYRADLTGYAFRHETNTLTDPRIDTAEPDPDEWDVNPIIYDLRMAATDFDLPGIRKWAESLIVKGKSVVDFNVANPTAFNTTLQISRDNDSKQEFSDLAEIYNRNQLTWGDPDIPYGDPRLWQSRFGIYDVKRMFNSNGGLRCSYMQLRFTNLFANIANSDLRGEAELTSDVLAFPEQTFTADTTITSDEIEVVGGDASGVVVGMGIAGTGIPAGAVVTAIALPIITISEDATANGSGISMTAAKLFPVNVENYWMTFESDDYESEFLIESIGGTVPGSELTLASAPPPNPTNKWVMKGFFKGDGVCLLGYTVNYVPLTDTQAPYRGKTGGNA